MKVKDDGRADLLTGKDKDGSTALNRVAWKGHVDVLEHLLERGADINAHNENTHWERHLFTLPLTVTNEKSRSCCSSGERRRN